MTGQSLQLKLEALVNKVASVRVIANVELAQEQLEALQVLRNHCLNQALDDAEVRRDPRKLRYKTAQELKYSLVAICLAQALTNPARRQAENKEYFMNNIQVATADRDWNRIDFGMAGADNVREAIFPEIINDWMIYRDKNGMGIKTLIDTKTNLVGLPDFSGEAILFMNLPVFIANIPKKSIGSRSRAGWPHRMLSAMRWCSRWRWR